VCINGLVERCGNAALDEIVVGLKTLLGVDMKRIRFDKLYELALLGEKYSGVPLAPYKPLTGRLTFSRESGLGIDVVKKEPRVGFSVHPALLGRQFEILLGKKSGRPSIRVKLEEMGIEASDEKVGEILDKVKQKAIAKKAPLSDDEFKAILKATL
jgi:methanogen homocitrate synthase